MAALRLDGQAILARKRRKNDYFRMVAVYCGSISACQLVPVLMGLFLGIAIANPNNGNKP